VPGTGMSEAPRPRFLARAQAPATEARENTQMPLWAWIIMIVFIAAVVMGAIAVYLTRTRKT
jgi:anti-sigma-K factor RskA